MSSDVRDLTVGPSGCEGRERHHAADSLFERRTEEAPGPTAVQFRCRPASVRQRFVTPYEAFELRRFPPGVHRAAPGRSLIIVVSLGDPLEVADVARFGTATAGLATRASIIRHDGHQHGVRISLTPHGARAIFGAPAAAFTDRIIELDDVVGSNGRELSDSVRQADTWAARFEVLDLMLGRLAARAVQRRQAEIRAEVAHAWRRLVERRGQIRIDALATELCWSRRHLSDRFRTEFGVTPKLAARMLRFEHAYHVATTDGSRSTWAQIAAIAGYSDQAHLVRDWQDFMGCSPTAWRHGEVLPPS